MMRAFRNLLGVVAFPFHIPFYLRCFFLGVRCGRLGIEISTDEIVALCR
jgi:hypothetical protein